ncbi:hypothetical protein F4604DRAFT_1688314 [Suillus subluteus]|nr:hypothetical protein F4604DRAFT_1688314 [Suillus subluteus]
MEEEYLCDCLTKCAGVHQHVSRATYYHHVKYRTPKATVFDKTLATLIQANSVNSSSVQLNDSDADVQPAHHHTLKHRRIDSGTHALSNDKWIIPAGDALEEHNDVPQVCPDVFEQIIPAGDTLRECSDVPQVCPDVFEQIIPAGDALGECNDVPQVHLDAFKHYDNAFPGLDDLDVHAGQDDSDGYAGQDDTSELQNLEDSQGHDRDKNVPPHEPEEEEIQGGTNDADPQADHTVGLNDADPAELSRLS